ncbi:hypothetical protein B0H63DRAFT_183201 [Podospora didyma]|uniref:Uncharacterized protein n=1 Tax=Podospora didyma TaxID=330526 RepID=A0AAE0TZQ5_9PEZI|nr:hypothetical protein B0H63DRAFT_183201 [Podospora didyma]
MHYRLVSRPLMSFPLSTQTLYRNTLKDHISSFTMNKLISLATGVLTLMGGLAIAAPADTPVEARQCTTTILPPSDLIIFDMAQPNEPGWSIKPSFQVALNPKTYYPERTGYKMIVRFTPPTTGSCAWVMSLPAARLENEAIQGKPVAGPVILSFFGVPMGGYTLGDVLGNVELKPGPYGVNAIQPGVQTIHAEPCNQIGGELFVEVPEWLNVDEGMWVYWPQDIQPANVTNSLGIYMRVQTC